MLIAIVSDIHDHRENLNWAIREIKAAGVASIIACGDYSSPDSLARLADLELPVDFCLGNTDDMFQADFRRLAKDRSNLNFNGRVGKTLLDGKTAAFTHYPAAAEGLAREEGLDAVFFGHTHCRHKERLVGGRWLANPGDIQDRHRDGPGFLLWDTQRDELKHKIKTGA